MTNSPMMSLFRMENSMILVSIIKSCDSNLISGQMHTGTNTARVDDHHHFKN